MSGSAARLQRLEDRLDIAELVALYGFVMDERDLELVGEIFCPDGAVRSPDGVFRAVGIDQVRSAYQARYDVLGPTNHVSHGHVVRFDPADPDRARGLVSAHAEVVRHGGTKVVALRYEDVYHRHDGRWRFEDRVMSYLYYLPVADYDAGLRAEDPMRADAGSPRAADWPWVLHDEPTRLRDFWQP